MKQLKLIKNKLKNVRTVTTYKKYTLTFKDLTIVGIGTTKQDAFVSICNIAKAVGLQPHWLNVTDVKLRAW